MNEILSGMLGMGYLVAAGFFFKFWRRSGDTIFALLALAFVTLLAERFVLAFLTLRAEHSPLVYLIRLVAFVLILGGIWNKNRKA